MGPVPVLDFGFVYAFGVRVGDAFDDLRFEPLLEMSTRALEARNAVDYIDGEREAIDLVANRELERRVDVALSPCIRGHEYLNDSFCGT